MKLFDRPQALLEDRILVRRRGWLFFRKPLMIAQTVVLLAFSAEVFSQPIKLGYAALTAGQVAPWMAKEAGYFSKYGIEAELIYIPAVAATQALIAGEIQLAQVTGVSTSGAILAGADVRIIASVQDRLAGSIYARPEIKTPEDLKGKKLGIATIRGTDSIVAEELLRSKGFNPNQLQQIVIGDTALRAQALMTGVVQAVSLSPPHDLLLKNLGYNILAGPPEVGLPASGLFTSNRLLKENPQVVNRSLRAVLRANRFIAANRQETIAVMSKWLAQTQEVAGQSYDVELKALTKDGQMTDAELESLIDRLGEKKAALDGVRDFNPIRQAIKELDTKQ